MSASAVSLQAKVLCSVTMKIAAFNVQNLGPKKVKDDFVVGKLVKIMARYTVIVILEVQGKGNTVVKRLKKELNETQDHPYEVICSEGLGRNSHNEKYAFFYREDEVELIDQWQYEDEQEGDEDAFAREPFIVRFKCPKAAVEDLVLIPIHTKPDDSEKEIDELDDVVREVEEHWDTENIMILGDFNADGRYMSRRKLDRSHLRSECYHWVIDDDEDTTVSGSNDHTYDRIVVYGEALKDAIVANSGKPYNFEKALRLSNENALRISDHYPVEVKLKAKRRRS
ncbi:unnamed protein product [Menidia menidia]|uniref:Deoxyribonuclease n=1 Tax=Menidia menidia TaxID=238744 RepID=A0A8S4BP64_9TELE|nr:unnamed protein product [Menidia menidia]